MQLGADESAKTRFLGATVRNGNMGLLEMLLGMLDANISDSKGCSAIYSATANYSSNRYAVFRRLLAAGARPNVTCDSDSPLHRLASYPRSDKDDEEFQIVKLLLRSGAMADYRVGEEWLTLIETALGSTHSNFAIVDLLLANGASLTSRMGEIVAKSDASERWVDFLADREFDFNIPGQRGQTPLMTTIAYGHLHVASALDTARAQM